MHVLSSSFSRFVPNERVLWSALVPLFRAPLRFVPTGASYVHSGPMLRPIGEATCFWGPATASSSSLSALALRNRGLAGKPTYTAKSKD